MVSLGVSGPSCGMPPTSEAAASAGPAAPANNAPPDVASNPRREN